MITIIKCESCGKALLEGDIYPIAGQLIIKVVPCGCKAEPEEEDCSECEDMKLLKKVQAELKEAKKKLAQHEAIP